MQIGHYASPHVLLAKISWLSLWPLSQKHDRCHQLPLHFPAHRSSNQQIQAEKKQLIDHIGFLQSTSNQQQHRCHATHLPCTAQLQLVSGWDVGRAHGEAIQSGKFQGKWLKWQAVSACRWVEEQSLGHPDWEFVSPESHKTMQDEITLRLSASTYYFRLLLFSISFSNILYHLLIPFLQIEMTFFHSFPLKTRLLHSSPPQHVLRFHFPCPLPPPYGLSPEATPDATGMPPR